LCFCTTWQNRETRKSNFQPNAVLVHCQKSTSYCGISSVLLTHNSYSHYCMTPKSCNQCVTLRAIRGGAWFRRKEVNSATAVGLCCMQNACAPVCFLPERKKLSSVMCLIVSITFAEILRYPINLVHWLSLQAWRRTTAIFYTATDTTTDLVNIERVGNRQQDAMGPSTYHITLNRGKGVGSLLYALYGGRGVVNDNVI